MNPFRLLICSAMLLSEISSAQDTSGNLIRTVDLNDQVVQASGVQQMKKKSKVSHTSLIFRSDSMGVRRDWDSTYLLTKFTPPSKRRFKLLSVAGRVKEFDTSMMEVNLVVLQMSGGDTLLREIPITANGVRGKKQQVSVSLRGRDLYLQPSEFYIGYSFRVKRMPEQYSYRLYAANGGEGVFLNRGKGRWRFAQSEHLPYVFPFTISFLEG